MSMHRLVLFRACGDRVIINSDGHAGPARIAGDACGGNPCFFDQLAQGALGRIGFARFEMAAGAEPYLKLLVMDGQVALLLVYPAGRPP